MTNEEITKEIIVSLIEKGFFDGTKNKSTHEAMRTERINSICTAFKSIAKTVNDCQGGKYE